MTLSLINLDPIDANGGRENGDSDADVESKIQEDDDQIRNLHGDGSDEN